MCCAHRDISPGGVLFSKNLITAGEVVGKLGMSPGDGCRREDEMSTVQFSSGGTGSCGEVRMLFCVVIAGFLMNKMCLLMESCE